MYPGEAERQNGWVPVDSSVCELVQRLRFSSALLDPSLRRPAAGRIQRQADLHQTTTRLYLSDVAATVGISIRIVPHQLRHTYATEMVRAGVSLPALMTLLGHVKAEMTHEVRPGRRRRFAT